MEDGLGIVRFIRGAVVGGLVGTIINPKEFNENFAVSAGLFVGLGVHPLLEKHIYHQDWKTSYQNSLPYTAGLILGFYGASSLKQFMTTI